MVEVNRPTCRRFRDAGWVRRISGRDLGAYALHQYTNVKSVWIAL